jgi:hypothetical protein
MLHTLPRQRLKVSATLEKPPPVAPAVKRQQSKPSAPPLPGPRELVDSFSQVLSAVMAAP